MTNPYYHTKKSVLEYIKMSKGFDGRKLIVKLQQYLSHNSRLLEIGSGPGTDWKILHEIYETTGSDISEEFIKHLSNNFPGGKFLKLDAVTLSTNLTFDAIYSNKVLHHLKDEELLESITRQHEIINKNGIICHSFWKGEGTEIFKGLFVNYHSASRLSKFFEAYFDILLIEGYAEFEDADSLLLIGKKKEKTNT